MEAQQNLQCTLEKEGFLGTFFPGTKYADKAVIFVGGSAEKRDFVEARAKLLAEEGFSVLSVGFYRFQRIRYLFRLIMQSGRFIG